MVPNGERMQNGAQSPINLFSFLSLQNKIMVRDLPFFAMLKPRLVIKLLHMIHFIECGSKVTNA